MPTIVKDTIINAFTKPHMQSFVAMVCIWHFKYILYRRHDVTVGSVSADIDDAAVLSGAAATVVKETRRGVLCCEAALLSAPVLPPGERLIELLS